MPPTRRLYVARLRRLEHGPAKDPSSKIERTGNFDGWAVGRAEEANGGGKPKLHKQTPLRAGGGKDQPQSNHLGCTRRGKANHSWGKGQGQRNSQGGPRKKKEKTRPNPRPQALERAPCKRQRLYTDQVAVGWGSQKALRSSQKPESAEKVGARRSTLGAEKREGAVWGRKSLDPATNEKRVRGLEARNRKVAICVDWHNLVQKESSLAQSEVQLAWVLAKGHSNERTSKARVEGLWTEAVNRKRTWRVK